MANTPSKQTQMQTGMIFPTPLSPQFLSLWKSEGAHRTQCYSLETVFEYYTEIPYRACTGPEQGIPCVVFPHR